MQNVVTAKSVTYISVNATVSGNAKKPDRKLMNHQSTDVFRYLIFLQKYLQGDLLLFEQLAADAEKKEEQSQQKTSNKGCLGFLSPSNKTSTTSSTTTITTTKYPYSFEFMFGNPVISRSTVPHTATLFATIDILGFLTRTGTDFRNTTKNFQQLFNDPSIQIDPTELSVLIKVYRHGMTHSYFPKLNMEISYHSKNPNGVLFFKNSRGDVVLNVNTLKTIVTTRLSHIINDLTLYTNMETQYNYLTQEYENDCRQDINALKARI